MVGSVDVKFPIRLEKLVLNHAQFSSYEPELFPGLIYRMVKPRIVLLIFVSGKVVLTGAKHKKGKNEYVVGDPFLHLKRRKSRKNDHPKKQVFKWATHLIFWKKWPK